MKKFSSRHSRTKTTAPSKMMSRKTHFSPTRATMTL